MLSDGYDSQPGWAVVLAARRVPDDRVKSVAGVVAEATGGHLFDASGMVRRAEGILLGNTTLKTAESVARALPVRAGVARVPELGRRWPVTRGGCSKRGLHAEIDRQGVRIFPWATVRLVAVARYHEPERGVPAAGYGSHFLFDMVLRRIDLQCFNTAQRAMAGETTKIAGDETYLADIFLSEPEARILRIDARRFHYGYLGDGMEERAELNFHLLLSHIATGAPDALFSPDIQRFLDGDLLADATIRDIKEFEHHSRWLLMAAEAFQAADH